jgi:sporulation protein YlmC with PRC-barrel domain
MEDEMLHPVGDLLGSPVVAPDGVVGRVLDVLFDERNWQIRYLLIKASREGRDREVLFPPEAVLSIDAEEGIRIDRLQPFELKSSKRMPCLRSTREVLDCTVSGWSGEIGRTEEVLFDESSWALRFLMIDVSSWCPGAVVFVRPDLVHEAQWERQSLSVAVTRLEVLSMPGAEPADVDAAHAGRVLH